MASLECPDCGWDGGASDADVVHSPSPDGHYARVYECPACHRRQLSYAPA